MNFMKLDIQLFADGKIVIETDLNTKDFEKGLNKIQNTSKSAGSTIKNIVAGLGITKLISTAMGQITSSIDGAISRYDTLNNFPNVMKNLGQSTEDSQKAIDKMAEKLSGLPTTLDQGAMAVQRFTSKNNDVKRSTDLFLALNNALLAGGASTEIQASALEQLSQAYAKGKPDMIEWRSAMTAMPAQLNQVAQAMGMVDADALGEALRNGTVSMDEFMKAIVSLNENGINGLESFEKQARGSVSGIRTAITVAKTQVVKGVTDIIEALDVKGEQLGIGKISDIISNVGKKAKEALDMVANLITGEISAFDFGKSVGDLITKTLKQLANHLPKFLDAGIKTIIEFARGLSETSSVAISNFVDLITNLLNTIIDNLDLFIDAAVDVILALVKGLLDNSDKIINAGVTLITKLITKLTDSDTMNKLAQAAGKIVVALAAAIIKNIPQILTALAQIKTTVTNELSKIPSKMVSIGANIIKGLWEGVKSQMGAVASKLQSWASNLVAKVKKTLKIASPSKIFRDEVGKMMAAGIGVGFEDGIKGVYADMQRTINFENAKLQSNVEMGKVFNTLNSSTPIVVEMNANVEMDNQKVGRLVAPSVMQSVKTRGGY